MVLKWAVRPSLTGAKLYPVLLTDGDVNHWLNIDQCGINKREWCYLSWLSASCAPYLLVSSRYPPTFVRKIPTTKRSTRNEELAQDFKFTVFLPYIKGVSEVLRRYLQQQGLHTVSRYDTRDIDAQVTLKRCHKIWTHLICFLFRDINDKSIEISSNESHLTSATMLNY